MAILVDASCSTDLASAQMITVFSPSKILRAYLKPNTRAATRNQDFVAPVNFIVAAFYN
jgi:hypothetical protein